MAEKFVIGNAELWHGDCRDVLPSLGDEREALEERAAIIQFCSGREISRAASERIAAAQMGIDEEEIEFLMGDKSDG